MTWLKTNHNFGTRGAMLTITEKQAVIHSAIMGFLRELQGYPDRLEMAVLDLIKKYRPELANCTVTAMEYEVRNGCWCFYVIHPSFPSSQASELVTMPLVPPPPGEESR